MAKANLLPGELFIVEYVDGAYVNRWAINASKAYVPFEDGSRRVEAGYVDIVTDGSDTVEFPYTTGHFAGAVDGNVRYLTDAGFRKQSFGGQSLTVLKTVNDADKFNSAGTKIGTLPAGTEIGIVEGDAGNSMKHLLAVTAYNNPNTGWEYFNESSYSYGFLNVQQGFGLKRYNTVKALETPFNKNYTALNWAEVAQCITTENTEAFLRNIPAGATRDEIVNMVNDYFSGVDMQDAILGDPIVFFENTKHAEFIVREATRQGLTTTADLFTTERNSYLSE